MLSCTYLSHSKLFFNPCLFYFVSLNEELTNCCLKSSSDNLADKTLANAYRTLDIPLFRSLWKSRGKTQQEGKLCFALYVILTTRVFIWSLILLGAKSTGTKEMTAWKCFVEAIHVEVWGLSRNFVWHACFWRYSWRQILASFQLFWRWAMPRNFPVSDLIGVNCRLKFCSGSTWLDVCTNLRIVFNGIMYIFKSYIFVVGIIFYVIFPLVWLISSQQSSLQEVKIE